MGEVVMGTVIGRKYRVDRVLGEGGMAVVLAATDLQLERPVALKLMLPELTTDPVAVARFVREARAAVRLRTEHIAHVYEVGTTDDGAPFMAMEYLEGADLDAVLHRDGMLRIEDACDYVLQACDAIAEAHAAGIIHRDLKPHNLFLTRRPNGSPLIKVLDFGISKVEKTADGKTQLDLTRTRAALGSPLYMAPEQMRSARAVDARVDIWALGVILYELLTGRVPFEASTAQELALMIVQDPAVTPRSLRPELPEGLAQVILRCLQKEPSARFASVAALIDELAPFAPKVAAPPRSSPLAVTRVPATQRMHPKDHAGFEGTIDSPPDPEAPTDLAAVRPEGIVRPVSVETPTRLMGVPSQPSLPGPPPVAAGARTVGAFGVNGSEPTRAVTGVIALASVVVLGGVVLVVSYFSRGAASHVEPTQAAPAVAQTASAAPTATATAATTNDTTATPSAAESATAPPSAAPATSASTAPQAAPKEPPVPQAAPTHPGASGVTAPRPPRKPASPPPAPAPASTIDPLKKKW